MKTRTVLFASGLGLVVALGLIWGLGARQAAAATPSPTPTVAAPQFITVTVRPGDHLGI